MSALSDHPTVLLSVSSFGAADDAPRRLLAEAGMEVRENPYGRRLKEEEIAALIDGVDALIAGTEPLSARVLDRAHRLRVISRVGVGLENVDLNAALRNGIVVRNTPDAVTDPVAEMALSGILNVMRRIGRMDREMRAGEWNRYMGTQLRGRTVGIVGLGRIGRRLAELLGPFECELIASDRAPEPDAAARLKVRYVELAELLARSDVVTLHVPGLDHPLIGRAEIEAMKPTAVLVNASRGGLVDEQALYDELVAERIAGAYIDTFADEPYSGPLLGLPNILLTPHAGSYAAEARVRMETEAVQNALQALEEFR